MIYICNTKNSAQRCKEAKNSKEMSKRIAIINDMSGFGRCSISIILPIISHLGVQGCPVPTAIFSNHTGFPKFYREDFTKHMPQYIDQWKQMELKFDGIMTGFLGSVKQIAIVEDFIKSFKSNKTMILVDPVMGDNGHIYPTYTKKMCSEMKKLIAYADIITPNITEACFLTDTPYKESGWHYAELSELSNKLMDMGAKKLVITGIKMGDGFIGNAISEVGAETIFQRQMIVAQNRTGTGDVFAAVLGADAVNGILFPASVKRASRFVRQGLVESNRKGEPPMYGIDFEEALWRLKRK